MDDNDKNTEGAGIKGDYGEEKKFFIQVPQMVLGLCETPYEVLVWMVVKMVAGEGGTCFMGLRSIAKHAMCNVATVSKAINRLIEIGLLEGEKKYLEGGSDNKIWHLSIPHIWQQNTDWRMAHNTLKEREFLKDQQQINRKARIAKSNEADNDDEGVYQTNTPAIDGGCLPDKQGCLPDKQGCLPGDTKEEPVEEEPVEEKPIKLTNMVKPNDFSSLSSASQQEVSYVEVDEYGDEIPRHFDKNDPIFQRIRMNLFGTPANLKPGEKTLWDLMLQEVAKDSRFQGWMIWQAEHNSRKLTFNNFANNCLTTGHFDLWVTGQFLAKDELEQKKLKRAQAGVQARPINQRRTFTTPVAVTPLPDDNANVDWEELFA